MNNATLFALAVVNKMAAASLCFNFESRVWNVDNIKPLQEARAIIGERANLRALARYNAITMPHVRTSQELDFH